MTIRPAGLKGFILGLFISLFFVGLSVMEWFFCVGLGILGYVLGLLGDRVLSPTEEQT